MTMNRRTTNEQSDKTSIIKKLLESFVFYWKSMKIRVILQIDNLIRLSLHPIT